MLYGLIVVLTTLFVCVPVEAQPPVAPAHRAYYLTANAWLCGACIRLNGFVVMRNREGTKMLSRVVDPYLKSGDNTLTILYYPPQKFNENTLLNVKITSVPKGDRLSTSKMRKQALVFKVQTQPINIIDPNIANVVIGKRLKDGVQFTRVGNYWEVAFRVSQQFIGTPSRVGYKIKNPPNQLDDIDIHFFRDHCPGRVIYRMGKSPNHDVKLTPKRLVEGSDLLIDGDPNMILIKMDAQTEIPPSLTKLTIIPAGMRFKKTIQFKVNMTDGYTWLHGQKIATLSEGVPDELWDEFNKLKTAVASGNTAMIAKLLKAKTLDLAKLTGHSVAWLEHNQTALFQKLAKQADWKLVATPRSLFHVVRLNNRVVKLERLDGAMPIVYESKTPQGKSHGIKMNPHYVKINGKWTIVP